MKTNPTIFTTPEIPPRLVTAGLYMRAWAKSDVPMLQKWWEVRGVQALPAEMLPPTGWIAERDGEPVAAAFALCAVGVGVATLEWIVAAPSAGLKATREALTFLVVGIKKVLASMDYGVLIARCPPQIARFATSAGFEICSTENINLIASTRH